MEPLHDPETYDGSRMYEGRSGYDILLEYMKANHVVDRQKARAELGFTETQMNRYQSQVMKLHNLEIRRNMMRPKHRTLVLIED